jgi:hypothetical protein
MGVVPFTDVDIQPDDVGDDGLINCCCMFFLFAGRHFSCAFLINKNYQPIGMIFSTLFIA